MSDRYDRLPKLGSKEFPRVGGGFDQDFPDGEIISIPICSFCRNYTLEDDYCKIYNLIPKKYLDNHKERDCKKFELNTEGLDYKYYKHLLKR